MTNSKPDYNELLSGIVQELKPYFGQGQQADYIPELANIDPNKFGISLAFLDGRTFTYGDSEERFSIQSISKVFTTAAAFGLVGKKLWERVDVEPSGTPFNSLLQLEQEQGIPRNPFINAGALVVTDVLMSNLNDPYADMLNFVRELSGCPSIEYNQVVVNSELDTAYRNAALAYYLKSFNNLDNHPIEVLKLYIHYCSIEMSCTELAQAFHLFARRNRLDCNIPDLTPSQLKRLNALMQTCGFYDESGEFSFLVGLPGKSGVGGGIAAVYPDFYSVAVWSPRLNEKGNSILGMKALELLTSKSGFSIF
ncbi:glutaminase [Lewinella cohaerens]|uniref:glutaminase n=1 Tax=Lewinella cohaerens TaxID=70995 RepID=UPI00035C87DB|nr:glutaminase [Lewinella cohaerens]